MCSISVVDVSKISIINPNPTIEDYHDIGNKIKYCLEQIGFVYLSNHGINQSTIDAAMKSSMEFFNLEIEMKNKTRVGKDYQGWREEGREVFGQNREIRETYDLKNISSSGIFPDEVNLLIYCKVYNIYLPQDCPQLREALVDLATCSKLLASRLLKCISLSLGCDIDYLDSIHAGMLEQGSGASVENCASFRSIHYPPIPDNLVKQKSIIRSLFWISAEQE